MSEPMDILLLKLKMNRSPKFLMYVEVAHELIIDVSVEIVDELTKMVIDESPNRVFVELVIEGTTVDFVVEVNDE